MRKLQRNLWPVLITLLAPLTASGDGLPSFEDAATKAQAATVTVRVTSQRVSPDKSRQLPPRVTVFSGVSLGDGLVAAPLFTSDAAKIRVTMPGGEQADARPRILDEHSGLALLEIDRRDVPTIDFADQLPNVGSWVLSAAAWGTETPVVSFGMVSGVDRRMAGTTYPALLQCDLTTADTSSGGPIVSTQGKLLGIIVAADAVGQRRGWTYAVPVQHLRRLLVVNEENSRSSAPSDEVVVLKRRRPTVGMEIGGDVDRVFVKRVVENGPASRAGIQVGDQIVAVDGVKIRSVYQAVGPTLFKQPGDTVTFLVQQDDKTKSIEVVLGGGVVLPVQGDLQLSHLIQPKITVNSFVLRNSLRQRQQQGSTAEVSTKSGAPQSKKEDQQQILESAVQRYQAVIDIQQDRMQRQQREMERAETRIETLESDLARLKEQLETEKKPDK